MRIDTCSKIGSLMAKIHTTIANKVINRFNYNFELIDFINIYSSYRLPFSKIANYLGMEYPGNIHTMTRENSGQKK